MLLSKKKLYKIRNTKAQSRKRYKKKRGGRKKKRRRKGKSFRRRRKALNLRKKTLKYKIQRGGAKLPVFYTIYPLTFSADGQTIIKFLLIRLTKPFNGSNEVFRYQILTGNLKGEMERNQIKKIMRNLADQPPGRVNQLIARDESLQWFKPIWVFQPPSPISLKDFCTLQKQILGHPNQGNKIEIDEYGDISSGADGAWRRVESNLIREIETRMENPGAEKDSSGDEEEEGGKVSESPFATVDVKKMPVAPVDALNPKYAKKSRRLAGLAALKVAELPVKKKLLTNQKWFQWCNETQQKKVLNLAQQIRILNKNTQQLLTTIRTHLLNKYGANRATDLLDKAKKIYIRIQDTNIKLLKLKEQCYTKQIMTYNKTVSALDRDPSLVGDMEKEKAMIQARLEKIKWDTEGLPDNPSSAFKQQFIIYIKKKYGEYRTPWSMAPVGANERKVFDELVDKFFLLFEKLPSTTDRRTEGTKEDEKLPPVVKTPYSSSTNSENPYNCI